MKLVMCDWKRVTRKKQQHCVACMMERERNLQQKLKRNEVTALILDEEVEDASLPELLQRHNTKQCNPKCQ